MKIMSTTCFSFSFIIGFIALLTLSVVMPLHLINAENLSFELSDVKFQPVDYYRNTPLSFTVNTKTTPNDKSQYYPFTSYPNDDSGLGSEKLLRSYGWYLGSLSLQDLPSNTFFSAISPVIHCEVTHNNNPRAMYFINTDEWYVKIVPYDSPSNENDNTQPRNNQDISLNTKLGIYLLSFKPPTTHDLWLNESFKAQCQPQVQLYPLVAPTNPSYNPFSLAFQSYSTTTSQTIQTSFFADQTYRTSLRPPQWKFKSFSYSQSMGMKVSMLFTPPASPTTAGWSGATRASDQWMLFDPLLYIKSPFDDPNYGYSSSNHNVNFASSSTIVEMIMENGWNDFGIPCYGSNGKIAGHFIPNARTISPYPITGVPNHPNLDPIGLIQAKEECSYSYEVSAKWLYSILVSTGQSDTIINPDRILQRALKSHGGFYGVNYHKFITPIVSTITTDHYPTDLNSVITAPMSAAGTGPFIELEIKSTYDDSPLVGELSGDKFRTWTQYTANIFNYDLSSQDLGIATWLRSLVIDQLTAPVANTMLIEYLDFVNTFYTDQTAFNSLDPMTQRSFFTCFPLTTTDQDKLAVSLNDITRLSLHSPDNQYIKFTPYQTNISSPHWRCNFALPSFNNLPNISTPMMSFHTSLDSYYIAPDAVPNTQSSTFVKFSLLSSTETLVLFDTYPSTGQVMTRSKLLPALNHVGFKSIGYTWGGTAQTTANLSYQSTGTPPVYSLNHVTCPTNGLPSTYTHCVRLTFTLSGQNGGLRPTLRIWSPKLLVISGIAGTVGSYQIGSKNLAPYYTSNLWDDVGPDFIPTTAPDTVKTKYQNENGDYRDIHLYDISNPDVNKIPTNPDVNVQIFFPLKQELEGENIATILNKMSLVVAPYHLLATARSTIPAFGFSPPVGEITLDEVLMTRQSWSLPHPRQGLRRHAHGEFSSCGDAARPYCRTGGASALYVSSPLSYNPRSISAALLDSIQQMGREICRAMVTHTTRCEITVDQVQRGKPLYIPPSKGYMVHMPSELRVGASGYFIGTRQPVNGMMYNYNPPQTDSWVGNHGSPSYLRYQPNAVLPTRTTTESIEITFSINASDSEEQEIITNVFQVFQKQLINVFEIIPTPLPRKSSRSYSGCVSSYHQLPPILCGTSCSPSDCYNFYDRLYARDRVHRQFHFFDYPAPPIGSLVSYSLGTSAFLDSTLPDSVATDILTVGYSGNDYFGTGNELQLDMSDRPSVTKNFMLFARWFIVPPAQFTMPIFKLETFQDGKHRRFIKTGPGGSSENTVLKAINSGNSQVQGTPLPLPYIPSSACQLTNTLSTRPPWCNDSSLCPSTKIMLDAPGDFTPYSTCLCGLNEYGPQCTPSHLSSVIDNHKEKRYEYIMNIPGWQVDPTTPSVFTPQLVHYTVWRQHHVLSHLLRIPGAENYPYDSKHWHIQPIPAFDYSQTEITSITPKALLSTSNPLFKITRIADIQLSNHLKNPYQALENFGAMLENTPPTGCDTNCIQKTSFELNSSPNTLPYGSSGTPSYLNQLPLPLSSIVINPHLAEKKIILDGVTWTNIDVTISHVKSSTHSPQPLTVISNLPLSTTDFPSKFYIPTLHPNVISQYESEDSYLNAVGVSTIIDFSNYSFAITSADATPTQILEPIITPLTALLPSGTSLSLFDCWGEAKEADNGCPAHQWIPEQLLVLYNHEDQSYHCSCTDGGAIVFIPTVTNREIRMMAEWQDETSTKIETPWYFTLPFYQDLLKKVSYSFYLIESDAQDTLDLDDPEVIKHNAVAILNGDILLANPADTTQQTVFKEIFSIPNPLVLQSFQLFVPHTVSRSAEQPSLYLYGVPNLPQSSPAINALLSKLFPIVQPNLGDNQTFPDFCTTTQGMSCPNGCENGTGRCLPSAEENICQKIRCPRYMVPSNDCSHCLCKTTQCQKYTRVGMVYYSWSENPASLSDFALLNTTLPQKMISDFNLNRLPINTTTYTTPTNIIGIESVMAIPIRPDLYDPGQLSAIPVFITITPFHNTSPEESKVQQRFDQIQVLWNALSNNWSVDTNIYTFPISRLAKYNPSGDAEISASTTLNKIPLNQPMIGASCLKTGTENDWSTCLTIPTSHHWSTCPPNPSQEASPKYLTPSCIDYSGYRWYYQTTSLTPLASWCSSGFPLFPSATRMVGACPGTQPPPPPVEPTLSNTVTLVTTTPLNIGDMMSVTWDYSGPEVNTVSIFLLGTNTMSTQDFSDDYTIDNNDNNIITTRYYYNHHDTQSLKDTMITQSIYDNHPPTLFSPLQSGITTQAIFLATFPARSNQGLFKISSNINPSTASRIQIKVTQKATLIALSPVFELKRFNPCTSTIVCAVNPNTASQSICNPLTSQCDCPKGMMMPLNTYDSLTSLCQLTCHDKCLNGGTCTPPVNNNGISKCACPDQFEGEFCQTLKACPSLPNCNNKGLIKLDTNQQCTNLCQCNGNWGNVYDQTDTSLLILDKQCTKCTLPCDTEGTNITLTTSQGCNTCVCNQGYSGEQCQVRSMYGAIAFGREEVVQSTPTPNPNSFIMEQQSQDLDESQEVLLFITLQTNPTTNSTTRTRILTMAPLTQFQLQQDTALSLGINPDQVEVKTCVQVTTTTPISGTNTATQQTTTTFSMMVTSSTTSSSGSPPVLLTLFYKNNNNAAISSRFNNSYTDNLMMKLLSTPGTSTNGMSIDDLYLQWKNLQSNPQSLPISTSPVTQEYGQIKDIQSGYDPNCARTGGTNCPTGSDPTVLPIIDEDPPPVDPPITPPETPDRGSASSIATIIIVVVVIVVVLAGVVVIALLLRYSNKNRIWCFAETEQEKRQRERRNTNSHHHPSNNNTQGSELSIATQSSDYMSGDGNNDGVQGSRTKSAKSLSSKPDFGQPNAPVSNRKTAIDLVQVHDDESANLPEGWTKWLHSGTSEVIYTNEEQMISQRHAPGTASTKHGRWF